MKPCDTCGKPTTDAMSHCEHSEELESLRAQLEEANAEIVRLKTIIGNRTELYGGIQESILESADDFRSRLAKIHEIAKRGTRNPGLWQHDIREVERLSRLDQQDASDG